MSASDLRGPGVPGDGSAAAGDAHGAVTPSAPRQSRRGDTTTAADHTSIAGAGTPGVSDSTTAGVGDSTTLASAIPPAGVNAPPGHRR